MRSRHAPKRRPGRSIAATLRTWFPCAVALCLSGCNGCPPAPPAQTPVLEQVLKPGPTPTTVGPDSSGEFQVLPSPSVIVRFRTPLVLGLEAAVDNVVLEQTSSVARQQALEAAGLGFWFHLAGSPDVNVTGDPRWEIAIAPAPALRTSQRFTITLTTTSSHATTPRSAPLTVRVAFGNTDWVSIAFNPPSDTHVVLLDGGRVSGCVDDELFRGRRFIDVGEMRAPGNCNEEIVVFTRGNAVQLFTRNVVWTDSSRDVVDVDLFNGRLSVPVDVWLLGPGLQARASADVARADVVYDASRCGIVFNARFRDVSGTSTAAALFGTDITRMENQAWRDALTGSAFFTAGRINVYYVGSPFTGRAVSGFTASPNLNIIGVDTTASAETLAHELGHSFTLGHSNGVSGIPATNIMMAGVTGRTAFTEGQCFRMNLNRDSTLNTNGIRGTWVRDCADGTTNSTCPALSFDVPN